MTQTGIPAADSDVEALILGDAFAGDDDTCLADAGEREVSMRGDLQQMPLADVFQSLGMSKMEGILRVRNLVETREVYFRDGSVRAYITTRAEARRIGIQLVQGGLMTPETLRAILFEQKKSRQDLRELLTEHRVLPRQEIDELFDHRAAEDLYSLFTWTQGAFDFYKGPPGDPTVQARFDAIKAFDINVVLMEVARRSDEWEVILDTIRSVDELVVGLEGATDLKGDHLEVLNALDGRRTIRMLAPSMLFGLFELCRIIRDLVEAGHARFATVAESLELVRLFLGHDRKKLASALLETLAGRPEGHGYADLHAIATLLQEAGEPRRAASTLITAAREAEDPTSALEMLRDARTLAPRSCEVLEQLRGCLLRLDDPERQDELRQITDDFCNALVEEGRLSDSLSLLDQMQAESPDDSRLTFRRAIVLHKLGRRDEAITGLMALAEKLKAAKQRDALAVVYEQVLKIDPRRRDVTRALRTLHATRMVRRLRVAAVVVALSIAAVAGVVGWRTHRASQTIARADQEVRGLLSVGDTHGAIAAIDRARQELGDVEAIAELRGQLDAHLAATRAEAERARAAHRRERLSVAASHFEKGEYETAMTTYSAILGDLAEAEKADVRDVVRARCLSLVAPFERLAQELPYSLPPAPGPTIDARARRQAIDDLQKQFRDDDLLRAKACLRAIEHEVFRASADAETATRLTKACTEIVRTFGLADVRRTAYQSLEANAEVGRRLHPLVLRANQYQAEHRYREAIDIYRTLVRDHPHEDELKQQFRADLEKCEQLTAGLDAVAAATAAGDAALARKEVATLRRAFPDVPVTSLVRLPIAITTRPPGATVTIAGEAVGRTPLRATFVPASKVQVTIDFQGFEPMRVEVTGEDASELSVTLTRQPDWSVPVAGAITQTPACDERRRVFAVDRSGRVTAFKVEDGTELWHVDTGDLSGLLPRPTTYDDRVVVASVDGTVRCLSADDGSVVWEQTELPVEVGPAAQGDLWLAATVDRRFVGLDSGSGRPRFSTPLPGTPAGFAVLDRFACCVTTTGDVVGVAADDGKELWHAHLGVVVAAPPVLFDGSAFVVGEDGTVAALAVSSGEIRWRRELGTFIKAPPVLLGPQLVIATEDSVTVLRPADGEITATRPVGESITSLSSSGSNLFVGTASGSVVCHGKDGELFRLRGPGRVSAAPICAAGWVLVGFEGRKLHGYRRSW